MTSVASSMAGNIPSLDLEVIVKPEDNNAEYKCLASNLATTSPLETKKKITVQCKFLVRDH